MSVLALHHRSDEGEARRYGAAALVIVLFHLALIAAAVLWYKRVESAGVSIPAILVDLAPAPAAQRIQTQDLAPGPGVQQAEAPPPEPPKREVVEEQLSPTPPQPQPIIAAPPKVEPKLEPTPVKPQPVHEQVRKPIKKRLVEQSTAAKADRIAAEAPAASSGASAVASAASYRLILAAHLQRFKQYPSDARNGERGKPSVSVTVTRSGRVTSSQVVRSSGFAVLDQAALALIRRAQPLPPFPPEMREASANYTVPFNFAPR